MAQVNPQQQPDAVAIFGQDGFTKADVRHLTNADVLNVAVVDGSGNQVTSFGGGGGGGGAVTIVDGGDTAEGATTDVAVSSDIGGTVSGKLRGLVKIFASVWDSINGRLKVDGSGVTQPVSGAVSVSNLPVTQPVSGTVTVQQSTAASLKVDISGTGANATAIKVDGSAVTQPVSGSVSVSNFPATQPVTGTVTANAGTGTLAVSAAALPLPAGAATGAKQDTISAQLPTALDGSGLLKVHEQGTAAVSLATIPNPANLDVALSTRTKPSDQQHVIVDSGALPSGAATETTLAAVLVDTADIELSTANLDVLLSTRTKPADQQHAIIDSGTTVVTQATGTNLHAVVDSGAVNATLSAETTKVIGTVNVASGQTIGLAAGAQAIGHVIVDTAPSTAITNANLDAPLSTLDTDIKSNITLHAGTNVIGHVIVDTAPSTAVTQSTTPWTMQGDSASGAAKAGNPVQVGGVFNTTQPTVTTGQTVEAQSSARGAAIVTTGADTFNVTVNAALPAGSSVIGHVVADAGSTTAVTGNVTVVQGTAANLNATVSGTVTTTPPANASTNVAQINAVTPLMGNGITGTGSQRVTIASDNTAFAVNNTQQGTASQNVAQVAGATTLTGNGTTGTGSQRVTIASDNTAFTVNAAQSGTWTVQPGNTANTTAWKVDGSAVTQPVQGGKTNNNAAPGATNVGGLNYVANASPPTYVEGNLVAGNAQLNGIPRVTVYPPNQLGTWALNGNVGYTATTQNGIIFSFRWGDATRLALLMLVQVHTIATAFTTAGLVERQLVVVRGFTASDTGGTALTPAANQNELRTSFPTSLVTDVRIGGFLSAGTGTADTNPLSSVAAWMAGVGNVIGGAQPVTLFDARPGGVQSPLVLAQNEGFRIRLGATETASTRMTFVNIVWGEVSAY